MNAIVGRRLGQSATLEKPQNESRCIPQFITSRGDRPSSLPNVGFTAIAIVLQFWGVEQIGQKRKKMVSSDSKLFDDFVDALHPCP
ncbi:hypothetical protein ACKFKF_29070 [Phormidesmis sp. 146-12]